ncbi:MAG: thioesterase family protein [Parvibaculum sp.]
MASGIPTLQMTVNTTHCDEIGHMNVQFYVAAGSDATRLYAAAQGHVGPIIARSDHIRFYRELRVGDIFTCHTVPVARDDEGVTLCHALTNRGTGELAATIITCTAFDDTASALTALPAEAAPRSIPAQSELPSLQLDDEAAAKLIPIYQGMVHPEHCDESGQMRQQFLISRFSDGAAHLWHHVGFDRDAMLNAKRGAVVLEMRVDRLASIEAGRPLMVKSAIVNVTGKVLHFAHFLFDVATGALLGTGEAAAVLFDLEKRKTISFSDQEIAAFTPHILKV